MSEYNFVCLLAVTSLNCVYVTVNLPRYVRVNTLKTTVEEVIQTFINDDGCVLVDTYPDIPYTECVLITPVVNICDQLKQLLSSCLVILLRAGM